MSANEIRGEVDLELEGQRFVLRPSYAAEIAIEKATGKSLVELCTAASDGKLTLTDTALVVTELIRAYAKSIGDQVMQAVKADRIGELIHEYGLMQVQFRLVKVLGMAITGGCKADGTPREDPDEGEATATETSATPVASSQE